ncbi:hypothetical protein ABT097_33465 [Streptomyces sp. NPDC002225]|uniref:hypothetical protein n=1 Tax=Streptomyces sp. NPDC002225 TaxID=3154413 RepID=UPI0033193E5B
MAEARRHLLETLRGRAFTRGLDDYIADAALSRHSRRLTVPRKGRQALAPDQLTYTADFAWPYRWWIAGTGGKPPRESSRYERARVAGLALQNAIRDARTLRLGRDEAPAATTSVAAHTDDQHHDQLSDPPRAVDHPGRETALTPAQRAAAVHAHQRAAMPEEHLEGRTTDPATWLYTPKYLARLAAFTRASEARSRNVADGVQPKPPAKNTAGPARQQQYPAQPDQGRGAGHNR